MSMCSYRPTFSHRLLAYADRGDADAQFELGRLYLDGRADTSSNPVSRDGKELIASFTPGVPPNHLAALRLLQKSADQGHPEARELLEVMKLHSPKGVP